MKHLLLFFFTLFLGILNSTAQQTPDILVTGNFPVQPLTQVLAELQAKYPVTFQFRKEWTDSLLVNGQFENKPLTAVLQALLEGQPLEFLQSQPGVIVLRPADRGQHRTGQARDSLLLAGKRLRITGRLRDAKTGEIIAGANITSRQPQVSTISNARGEFSLLLPVGETMINISFVGYEPDFRNIDPQANSFLEINLFKKSARLNEVQITGRTAPDQNISRVQAGVITLNMATLNKMPAFLGEVDIIKSIKLLPGVSSIGEAATGFNVRGGSADQNLVLLDDAPIFNTSHLFGFFSVFNPNTISDLTLYRGGIPAQFGGRISSVLDVKQKEGNLKKIAGTGGIGLISGRLALEGPIVRDKTSFLVAGRSSYAGWMFKKMPTLALRNSQANFYDLSAKIGHAINEKNKITLSGYRSHDDFGFARDTVYKWTNSTASLKYSHIFTNNFILDLTAAYSNYDFHYINEVPQSGSDFNNGITSRNLKVDFLYTKSRHQVDFGASAMRYTFIQGEFQPLTTRSETIPFKLPREQALETGLYVNDEYEISARASLTLGLRYTFFANLGPGQVFQYVPGEPKKVRNITDTLSYSPGEIIQSYQGLEPRLSFKFSLTETSSLKFGLGRNRQYIHLLSNTSAASPIDTWKTSNTYIQPQTGEQISLGYFRNFGNNGLETSVEGYYKRIKNLLDYKEGSQLFLNEAIEADLLPGKGKAYGLEWAVNKKTGKLTGWFSYTYSRSLISVNGPTVEESVLNGQYYPTNFDKPHTLNLSGNYQTLPRLVWGFNFTYSSGRPLTAPTSHYLLDGRVIPNFGDRNQDRIPDYHRLDLSVAFLPALKQNKKWEGTWNVSLYNAYGRKNAYSVFFKQRNGEPAKAYRLAVIGMPLPALTYDFKF